MTVFALNYAGFGPKPLKLVGNCTFFVVFTIFVFQ